MRGDRQWIFLRGERLSAPILFVLHGGPGSPQLPLTRHFDANLVDHFIVAHWDQPGAGKSIAWGVRSSRLTIERYVEDTIAVADKLRARFHRSRVVLLGHSWGTVIGTYTVARRPDLFSAWVSVGTDAIPAQAEEIGYRWVLGRARAANHAEAIRALEQIGPPPYDGLLEVQTERDWLEVFGGGGSHRPERGPGYFARALSSPEYSTLDLVRLILGNVISPVAVFWDYLDTVDLIEQNAAACNRHSGIASRGARLLPPGTARRFEESAHRPHLEEPEKFARVLEERVLPLAEPESGLGKRLPQHPQRVLTHGAADLFLVPAVGQ